MRLLAVTVSLGAAFAGYDGSPQLRGWRGCDFQEELRQLSLH